MKKGKNECPECAATHIQNREAHSLSPSPGSTVLVSFPRSLCFGNAMNGGAVENDDEGEKVRHQESEPE